MGGCLIDFGCLGFGIPAIRIQGARLSGLLGRATFLRGEVYVLVCVQGSGCIVAYIRKPNSDPTSTSSVADDATSP